MSWRLGDGGVPPEVIAVDSSISRGQGPREMSPGLTATPSWTRVMNLPPPLHDKTHADPFKTGGGGSGKRM